MADRVQVRDLDADPKINPVSAPVDSYIRPTAATFQEDGGNPLYADLASALNSLKPHAADYQKTVDEAEVKKGIDARLSNQKSLKKMVEDGELNEAANPWFVKGWMQQDGRISGQDYDAAMRIAYTSDPAATSTNPGDVTKFMTKFRQDWIKQNDTGKQDWMDGFRPHVAQAENNLLAQHVSEQQKAISAAVRENTGREVGNIYKRLDEFVAVNGQYLMPGDMVKAQDQAAAEIQNTVAAMVKSGLPWQAANEAIAGATLAHAEVTGNRSVLNMLYKIKTPGGTLGDIPKYQAQIVQMDLHLINVENQKTLRAEHAEDRPHAIAAKKQAEKTWAVWADDQAFKNLERSKKGTIDALTSEAAVRFLDTGVLERGYLSALGLSGTEGMTAIASLISLKENFLSSQVKVHNNQVRISETMNKIDRGDDVSQEEIWGGAKRGEWDHNVSMQMESQRRTAQKEPIKDPAVHAVIANSKDAIKADIMNMFGDNKVNAGQYESEAYRKWREIAKGDGTDQEKLDAFRVWSFAQVKHYNPAAAAKAKIEIGPLGTITQKAQKPATIRDEAGKPGGATPAKPAKPAPERFYNFTGTSSQIPMAAMDALDKHPDMAAEFEKKYSLPPGLAQLYINRKR